MAPSNIATPQQMRASLTTSNTSISPTLMSSARPGLNNVSTLAAAGRFHQKIAFYSKTAQKEIRVTFATAGLQDKDAPTILFAGGIYGGRWNALYIDYLCNKKGVRVIIADRPGIGGSSPAPLAHRVLIWLETVPHLLTHLSLTHVSLASHSSGIIYLLNTLYHLPQIIQRPPSPSTQDSSLNTNSDTNSIRPPPPMKIYTISPWVHPSKSGVKTLALATLMPTGLIAGWNKVTSFFVNNLLPSASAISSSASPTATKLAKSEGTKIAASEKVLLENCGFGEGEKGPIREYFAKMFFAEETAGVSEEAKLGLKSSGAGNWGACEDYKDFVGELSKKLQLNEDKVCLQAYFGERDGYIGRGGIKYFTKCWTGVERVDIRDVEIIGLGHEDLTLPENEVLGKIFDEVLRDHGV